MRIKRFFLSLLLMLSLILPCSVTATAADASDIIRDLLMYYAHHQEKAEADITHLLEELRALDPDAAEDWQQILEHWHYAYTQLDTTQTVLPDGLPEDDSLCIVVMGFSLNYNGTMRDELLGRLQVVLDAAGKYPNAYILCTGGGTAQGNRNATEADVMAKWLLEQGIDPDRVIVENRAYTTEHNAMYSLEILSEEYPEVDRVALVSSDYHLIRCYTLFHAAIILSDSENQYSIVASAGFDPGHDGNEDPPNDAESLGPMVGLTIDKTVVPTLAQLTEINVQGDTEYENGESLNLTVTAAYDKGFTRDMTADAVITGYDPVLSGAQTVTVQYTENDITVSAKLEVFVAEPPTETTIPPTTTLPTPTETEEAEPIQPESPHIIILLLPLSLALIATMYLIHILRKEKKRRRRRRNR